MPMPHVHLLPLIELARQRRFALPSFNVFNLETALAVAEAAEQERSPLVIAVAEVHFAYTDFELLAAALVRIAARATVPMVLHLDHAETLDIVMRAIQSGFSSFQFDGYGLPFEERIRRTRSVTDLAHSMGYAVEAELGHITRVGTDAQQRDANLADPSLAARFSAETGVDIIAAALGNVHGQQTGQGALDFELLAQIAAAIPGTISLHGGSGLTDADIRRAVEIGVGKVSYYNNLGRAASRAMKAALDTPDPQYSDVTALGRIAFRDTAAERIRAFGASGQADAGTVAMVPVR
jgi:fructose-bisphosphate aldolase class II